MTLPTRSPQLAMSRYFGIYALLSFACALLTAVRPLHFLSDDGLFYLIIAQYIAAGQGSTFNGLFPTNGYHPLWECIATLLAFISRSRASLLAYGIFVQWAMSVATLWVVLKALRSSFTPAALGAFCAVMFVLFVPFGNLFWSEAPLSMLFVALVFYMVAAEKPIPYAVLGLVLGLAFLARLDNVFYIGIVVVALFWRDRSPRLALTCLICAVLAGIYLATNWFSYGELMPISGAIKSAAYRHRYFAGHLGTNGLLGLFGALALIAINVVQRSSRSSNYRLACFTLCGGVLAHAAYVWALTYGDTTWVWYYVQGYFCLALAVAQSADWLQKRYAIDFGRVAFAGSLAVSAAIVAAKFLLNWSWHDPKAVAGSWRAEWTNEIQRTLPDDHSVLVVVDQPGFFAYGTTHPVFALDGLTMNHKFEQALAVSGMPAQLQTLKSSYYVGPMLPAGAELHVHFIGLYGRADGQQIVQFFTPLRGIEAGCINIDPSTLVLARRMPEMIAGGGTWGVWKLTPETLRPVPCPAGRVNG